jgi:hypothetical protein
MMTRPHVMSPRRAPPRAAGLFLLHAAALIVIGCPQAPEIVELGTIALALWTPEDDDYLDDASSITITTVVDGETTSESFAAGDTLTMADVEAAPEGSIVSVTVATEGSTLPDAVARTGDITLTPESEPISTVAILSARGLARRFTELLPDNRDDAAVCSDAEGTILVTGGARAAAPVAGSVVFDPRTRTLIPGPGQALDAVGAACAILDDGSVLLLAGAAVDGTGVATLYSAPSVRQTTSFVESALTLAGGKRAFGATMVRHGDSLWLQYDDIVERRPIDDIASVTRATLSEAHLFGSLAADDAGAVIAGGFTDAARTVASTTGHLVAASGTPTTRPTLVDAQVAAFGGRIYALVDDGVVRLTGPAYDLATAESIRTTDATSRSRARGAFLALADDVTAFVSADGATLSLVSSNAVATSGVSPAHPGGALVAGVTGAIFIVGGAAGSSVFVVDE